MLKAIPCKTTAVRYTRGEPHSNWPGFADVMLCDKSRMSDKQWVLDVAGGQYGIAEVLHEWPKYEHDDYVDEVVGVYQLGAHKRIMIEASEGTSLGTLFHALIGRAAVVLDKVLTGWETLPVHVSMRTLDIIAFAAMASLVDKLDTAVQTLIPTNDFSYMARKAKAGESVFTQHLTKMTIDPLTAEANLLPR